MERGLRISGAVNLVGARATGKTTLGLKYAASDLDLDPSNPGILNATKLVPQQALNGEKPRLLDEWQLVPELWSAVRRAVDRDNTPGQFILSGSAWPENKSQRHSGAGRFLDIVMRPMSLFESGESTGEVSLADIDRGAPLPSIHSKFEIPDLLATIIRGGWPAWLSRSPEDAQVLVTSYIHTLAQRDFPEVAGDRRAPERFIDFIRAYATLTARPTPLSTVAKRLNTTGVNVGRDFPGLHHSFAQQLYIVEDQPAWTPARRSKKRLVANPKRHLICPSLAAAAMGMGPEALAQDPETLGLLFESLVVRDLRIYSQFAGGKVYHYRTSDAVDEIDAIVEYPNGSWIGVEVKLGWAAVEKASEKLKTIAQGIHPSPIALVVIVPGGPTVTLENGVNVIPISLLGP